MRTVSSRREQSVLERLDREPLAWLCTLRSDGSPHQTPVWFVFHDATLWICSAEKNRKVRNVRLDPRVSVALEGGSAPVVAEGRATLRPCDFSPDVIERFRTKYGWDITSPNEHEGPRVLLEIPVARWLLSGIAQ
jgi:PPOX class probable F420-dependent enzyme